MNWIEGLGPAGIGKTTFLRKLLLKSQKQKPWVTEYQGLSEIIRNPTKPDIKKRFLKYYFRQSLINFRKQQYLKSQFLFGNEVLKLEGEQYNALLESYIDFLREKDNETVVDNLGHFLWYVKIIKTMCAFDYYNYEKLILFDEGAFQNHPNLRGMDWQKSILPKGLIFFHLEPELNFKRIMKRSQEGITRIIHKGLDDQELENFLEIEHEKDEKEKEVLRRLNIPIMDVDLSQDNEIELQKVHEFLVACSNTVNI